MIWKNNKDLYICEICDINLVYIIWEKNSRFKSGSDACEKAASDLRLVGDFVFFSFLKHSGLAYH